jgi:hypothetical protein
VPRFFQVKERYNFIIRASREAKANPVNEPLLVAKSKRAELQLPPALTGTLGSQSGREVVRGVPGSVLRGGKRRQ